MYNTALVIQQLVFHFLILQPKLYLKVRVRLKTWNNNKIIFQILSNAISKFQLVSAFFFSNIKRSWIVIVKQMFGNKDVLFNSAGTIGHSEVNLDI